MERRSKWTFSQDAEGRWTWWVERPDGTSLASDSSFESLNQCVTDSTSHGYVMHSERDERRAEPTRPPISMISQETWCPHCRHSSNLERAQFVSRGDTMRCEACNKEFTATPETVMCCVEDGEGLRELPLP